MNHLLAAWLQYPESERILQQVQEARDIYHQSLKALNFDRGWETQTASTSNYVFSSYHYSTATARMKMNG